MDLYIIKVRIPGNEADLGSYSSLFEFVSRPVSNCITLQPNYINIYLYSEETDSNKNF